MNIYPYEDLLSQLRFFATPLQYEQALKTRPADPRPEDIMRPPAYRALLPNYPISICPFCKIMCRHEFDTYRLRSDNMLEWKLEQPIGTRSEFPEQPPCEHFLGVQLFYHLHEAKTLPLSIFGADSGDVPYLSDYLFEVDDVQTYAILHALPVCELIDDTFIPMYTAFLLTYYVSDRPRYFQFYFDKQDQAYERLKQAATQYGLDYQFHPDHLVVEPAYGNFDLGTACRAGKLGWLDISGYPDVNLKLDKNFELPRKYRNIQGYKRKYTWSMNTGGFRLE